MLNTIISMLNRSLFFIAVLISSITVVAQTKEEEKVFSLGIIRQLHSVELNENRTLNIYLPESFHKDSSYPVIYLLDGSADEDFIHVAGLVQFYNFPWVNVLPKSIVVGIANVDRRRDFTFHTTIEKDKKDFPTTGGSEKFIRFIEKELQPYINKSFKTTGNNMLIGQSLGGLLATEVLFKKPELFSQYVIVSPSLWWDNESLLKAKVEPFKKKIGIYIAVGKEGKLMEEDAKALSDLLKTKLTNGTIQFEYISNKEHGNIFHQAVANAFEFFGEKK
ncbi:alpha/beta hydrolase-fold protein [Lacibacter sp. H375]|uniref:alpha/beta hydrolase n=1 Tax=Lacibacter sp. H375 TaxID=3133424 RepID=UPI0030C0E816